MAPAARCMRCSGTLIPADDPGDLSCIACGNIVYGDAAILEQLGDPVHGRRERKGERRGDRGGDRKQRKLRSDR